MRFSRNLPVLVILALSLSAWTEPLRRVSGTVVTEKQEVVTGVSVTARYPGGERTVKTDDAGRFFLEVPGETVTLTVSGRFLAPNTLVLSRGEPADNLSILVRYKIPPAHQSLVVSASTLDPTIDRRNEAVYSKTLFGRDDQIFDTLASGINAGQHEGGGKSLEIRRFGFNLDHGGVNGGLKVLVDDVQQNQASQGHGQGYLGALKSLTPELIDDVDILNGPFSAEYGDFSGLGVVHIRLKERLPDLVSVRLQGGSFGAVRGFAGFSPALEHADAFLAYEGSRTEGPFLNPLHYNRHNITGNYTRHLSDKESLGFKVNFGSNDFFSSGQIPTDLVGDGQLNRYGYIDPFDGGRIRLGTLGVYYKRELASGDIFRLDGFLARSLFDLYSNFTFFLNNPNFGDEIQQHDSRLQQGVNAQYVHPYKIFGHRALLTAGMNFHDNQINVGLFHTQDRIPLPAADLVPAQPNTSAHAHVTNVAGYAQQGVDLLHGRLHFDAGLRYDYFRFNVEDHFAPANSGLQGAARLEPKANAAYTPSARVPVTFYASYGRGISSQDARGVVQRPAAPRVATTDFYQIGTAYHLKRFSVSTDMFLIERSNEQVYIPDDGSFEFKGPSHSYGWEAKTSVEITHHLNFNGGFTQVSNAFYPGTFDYYQGTLTRVYVDSAPHSVGNAGITVADWHGFYSSLRYRHISAYRLDGVDPSIRATGLDVVDLSTSRRIRPGLDFNFSIDNLTDKRYWETQNYLNSRVTLAEPIDGISRVHATPGYPIGFTVGLTFRLMEK